MRAQPLITPMHRGRLPALRHGPPRRMWRDSPHDRAALSIPLRFVVHFTPTSSSWLNLVERWFAELTTKKLRRRAHRSVRQPNADIRAWITTWNDDPKPFVWTKTTDQILASIAATADESTNHETGPSPDLALAVLRGHVAPLRRSYDQGAQLVVLRRGDLAG
jgi:hypothetical protein